MPPVNVSKIPPVDSTLDLQSDEEVRGTQLIEYFDMSSWAANDILYSVPTMTNLIHHRMTKYF